MNERWIWKRLILTAALLSGALIGSETVWAVDTIQFEKASYSTKEGSQTGGNFNVAKLTVTRKGNFKNVAFVTVKTEADGAATPKEDFSSFAITLTFRNGENSKTLNIPITPDLLPERDETFSVRLSNIGPYNPNKPDDPNNVYAGQIARAEVTIVNDDPWEAPKPPTGLIAHAAIESDNVYRVGVNWDCPQDFPNNNIAGYDVWRNIRNNPQTADKIKTQAATPHPAGRVPYRFLDTAARQGGIYYYWVRATNNAGASAFSDYARVGPPPPTAPTGVKATDGESKDKVLLTWDKMPVPNDDDIYTVWRSADNKLANATLLCRLGTAFFAYEDKSAKPGVNYYYWVAEENVSGASEFSAGDSGFCGAPPKPVGVKASHGLYQKVRVTWNAASDGVLDYTILRNTKNDSSSATKIRTSRTTVYEDTTASRYKTYYYWVQARNSIGLSEFSVAVHGSAGARAQTGLTPSSGGTNPGIAPYVIINGQVYGEEPGDSAALQANADISDTLKVEIYLRTAEETSKEVKDWWVLGRVNDAIYIYTADGCWKTLEESDAPTYQGASYSMDAPQIVLDHPMKSLPSGVYTFFFGWDTNADGTLDLDKLVGATGEVIVQ